MSQQQSGLIESYYVYVPGIKTAMFGVANDKESIQEIMEGVAKKLNINLDKKYIMAGGVILNKSLSFRFYKKAIMDANKIISIVSIPTAAKVSKLPKAINFNRSDDGTFEFPNDEKVKREAMEEKAKLEAKLDRPAILKKLDYLYKELLELKKIADEKGL